MKQRLIHCGQAAEYAAKFYPFRNSSNSLFSLEAEGYYAVFSYGRHFPLYIFHKGERRWYGNQSRYSVSTAKHRTQAMPVASRQIEWRDTRQMQELLESLCS